MPESTNIAKLSAALPESVTFTALSGFRTDDQDSYYDVEILDDGNGVQDNFLEGLTLDAWCTDADLPIDSAPGDRSYTAKVYSSYDLDSLANDNITGAGNAIEQPENLDAVNWLINQDFSSPLFAPLLAIAGSIGFYNFVQVAIWQLVDDGVSPTSNLFNFSNSPVYAPVFDQLVDLALTNGEGFVPSFGQKMAVILVPDDPNIAGNPDAQSLIVSVELSKLGDTVFEDFNANGIQDAGDTGIAGATVNLLADVDGDGVIEADEIIDTTTTDANGNYEFTVIAGDYKVVFETPDGFDMASPANVGGDDAVDSDGPFSDTVSLDPGEEDPTIDAGFFKKASLGNKVFVDGDRDGIQDAGEEGVEGVTVTLTGGGADGVIGTADDTTDTTTTDANGEYLFDGLNPGEEYKVTFDASTATNASDFDGFTSANQGGDDTVDSDADPTNGMTQVVTLSSGEFNDTLDAGLVEKTASLGNKVFVDSDRDGIQDAGEAGVEGVTVTLTGGGADGVIGTADDTTDTTTTDANGEYLFDGLNPGEEYKVTFDASTATNASDFSGFTDANAGGDDTVDSDADPTTGMTQVVTLAPGEFNDTLDAGLVEKTASLGNKVFVDGDRDGIQDAGEAGVEGVTVTLTGGGADGVIGTADDTTDTTTTDANGEYLFDGLNPDEEYKVTFDASTATNASDFDGFTSANQGGDDTVDSDADPTTGMTQVVTLAPGEFNDTLDAGLVEKTASLGNKVFVDGDRDGIQDAGEAGVEGVTVTLTGGGADGVIGTADDTTDTTTTDANGEYLFDGLNPGEEYKVTFDASTATNASDFSGFTDANAGGDDTVDSDADPTTGMTQVVTLAPGEFNDTLDAGLVEFSPDIDIEKFVNGEDADTAAEAVEIAAGNDAVFTYEVTNTGDKSFAAADVIVTDDNGTAGDTSDDFNPDQVLSGGFNVGDVNQNNFLDAGETWSYTKTLPAEALGSSTTTTVNNVIDFDNDGAGNPLSAGTVIDNEYASLGVTISARGGSGDAMIFDSANPTGGDSDLATATEGNILIISEDGDSSDPDDNAGGGKLIFKFDEAVDINSINFVDIEETGGKVFSYDSNGVLIDTTNIPAPGDGSLQTLTIDNSNVSKVVVKLKGSGAVSGLDFDSFETDTTPGLYTNIGSVTAGSVSDEDAANYVNPEITPEPGIKIEKFTNGLDVDFSDLPEIAAGSAVTFTYEVSNTGNVAFAQADVVVTDDNGTAGDTSDDFTATLVASSDVGSDGILSAGETWTYTSGVLAAEDLSVTTASEDVTFYFNGNSYTTGYRGNTRNFSAGGVDVEASAFSSNKSFGDWNKAYLGSYNGGLGVTNKYENGSGHRADNGGSLDYILLEFDESVVVDKAFLKYVGHDSDVSIWVGDRNGDITHLNNNILNSLTKQNNFVNHGGDRWANFTDMTGNTVVISAFTGGSNDSFKLQKLNVEVAGETVIGDYINTATVTADGVSDSDQSGYTNPEAAVDPIHYEVGDMHLCNYREKHIDGFDVIQLTAHSGYATQEFDGLTGTYDIIVGYFDENDGHTSASVSIDGQVEASWVWNQNLGSNYVSDHNQAQYIIDDVHIGTGDTIKIAANFSGGEYGRFDYVKIVASDTISSVEEGVQDQLLMV